MRSVAATGVVRRRLAGRPPLFIFLLGPFSLRLGLFFLSENVRLFLSNLSKRRFLELFLLSPFQKAPFFALANVGTLLPYSHRAAPVPYYIRLRQKLHLIAGAIARNDLARSIVCGHRDRLQFWEVFFATNCGPVRSQSDFRKRRRDTVVQRDRYVDWNAYSAEEQQFFAAPSSTCAEQVSSSSDAAERVCTRGTWILRGFIIFRRGSATGAGRLTGGIDW